MAQQELTPNTLEGREGGCFGVFLGEGVECVPSQRVPPALLGVQEKTC